MINFFKFIDFTLAEFILDKIKNPRLDSILSKINRGEIFFIIILITFYFQNGSDPLIAILYTSLFSFINDRTVLILKKKISRERPALKILGKENNHPDLSHSFPSAHAANSMVALILLVNLFGFSPNFFLFSILAGIGRMLSLHHFLSDVLGGWLIGAFFGYMGVFFYLTFGRF